MPQPQLEEAAAFLFHLWVQRQTATGLPAEITPRSLDDAYAIQDLLHATAAWETPVLKVGCTSEFARKALGLDEPIGGRVPADAVYESGATIDLATFCEAPLIECEFALRVGESGAIDAVAPAFELVDPRVRSASSFGGIVTVADNSGGAATVIGTPIPIEDAGDLTQVGVALYSGNDVVAEGSGADVLGGPMSSVDWMHAHEAARGRTVVPGTWVITGTCTGITPAAPGTTYRVDFGSLGAAEFTLGT